MNVTMSSLSLQSPLVAIPLFSALTFLIVSSPAVYKFTDTRVGPIFKLDLASRNGAPTRAGLIVHAIVAAIILYAYLRVYSAEAALY
jgi:hypothetical protein